MRQKVKQERRREILADIIMDRGRKARPEDDLWGLDLEQIAMDNLDTIQTFTKSRSYRYETELL